MVRVARNFRAFSLIETLVVIAILLIVAAISYQTFYEARKSQSLEKDAGKIVSVFERARSLTLSSSQDRQYGVHIESAAVTIFPGNTYSVGNSENIVETLGPLTVISSYTLSGGGANVVFDRLTGKTAQSGTIIVSLASDPSRFYTITILGTGIIEVQ